MTNATRRRSAGALLTVVAFAAAAIITMMIPGFMPWSPAHATSEDVNIECSVQFLALNPDDPTQNNPNKEVPGAFGPAASSFTDEAVIKADLAERRNCGEDGRFDPSLTAAHYVVWSEEGLTSQRVSLTNVDAFQAKIAADPALYRAVTDELTKLESSFDFSLLSGIPAGAQSLYMMPGGNGNALVKSGSSRTLGTSAVFTKGDVVIRYRLDCGYQPWWPPGSSTPELPPACVGEECNPPEVCPPGTVGTPPDCNNRKWQTPTTEQDGWDPRGTDNGVTDGGESRRQQESGETRGNAGDDKVPGNTTNGSTTPDTKPSGGGGPVAPDAKPGGDDQSGGAVDTTNTNQNVGGTTGDTCVPDPIAGISC